MATAIIGTGNIGGTLARHLVRGGEPVVLAAETKRTQQRSRKS
jgi:predicted dinucleotide-binding enzyme